MPAAGYPLRPIRSRASAARTRSRRRARCVRAAGARGAAARGSCATCGPDAVLGGGGYVAGPVGLAAVAARVPLVLAEADSHLGLTNRLLAPRARRVCLAFPLEGRDGARYRGHRAPVPPHRRRPRRRPRRFGIAGPSDLRARLRRLARGPLDQRGGRRGLRRRAVPRPARRGPRDSPRSRPRPPAPTATTCATTSRRSARRSPRPTSGGPRRGSVFELAQYGLPRGARPLPARPADHRPPTRAGWRTRGAAVVIPDAELDGARLRARSTRCWATPGGWPRWRRLGRRSRGPGGAEIADEVRAAAAAARADPPRRYATRASTTATRITASSQEERAWRSWRCARPSPT